jgi:hypothetical protein
MPRTVQAALRARPNGCCIDRLLADLGPGTAANAECRTRVDDSMLTEPNGPTPAPKELPVGAACQTLRDLLQPSCVELGYDFFSLKVL